MESYRGTVRTPKDALLLLEAARLNMIPRVKRRLKDSERRAIRAGDVFIWNEKEAKMRRWTDGRSWSASRVTGAFLTYKEMENSASLSDIDEFNMSNYSYKNDGLIKQSFCITTTKGDKLHLISYSNLSFYADSAQSRPSNDAFFATIQIPEDLYPTTIIKTEPAQQIVQNPVQQKQQQPKQQQQQQQQLTPAKSPLQLPSSPTTQPYATSYAQCQPIQPLPSPAYVPRYQSLQPSPPMTQLPLPLLVLPPTFPREVKAYHNDVLALNALDRTF